METGNVPDRYDNISVCIGPQYLMNRYGKDQKAIRYDEKILQVFSFFIDLKSQKSRFTWLFR